VPIVEVKLTMLLPEPAAMLIGEAAIVGPTTLDGWYQRT
jgi:hypothetical protein